MTSSSTDRFLRAAGGRGPIRILVSAESGPEKLFEFPQPFVLIGSHQRADVPLSHADVSGRQLYLQLIGGRLFAVHLSGRSPTLWGAEPRPAGWIDGRTVLRVGPYRLRFPDTETFTDAPAAGDPLVSGPCPGPVAALELQTGGAATSCANLNRPITLVGTFPFCKVRIHHSTISTVHCSLVRTTEGPWVVDLGSRSGVQVNRAVVRTALLGNGDVLELGSRRLVVRVDAAGPSPAPHLTDNGASFGPTELVTAGDRPPLAAADAAALLTAMAPVLDRLAGSQAQTVGQFQDMLGMMIRAFGAMFNEHREFVKDELARLDQMSRTLGEQRPGGAALPAAPAAQPPRLAPDLSSRLPPVAGAAADDAAHAWLQQRLLQELGDKRGNLWEKMATLFRARASESPGG